MLLSKHVATTTSQHTVNIAHRVLRNGDAAKVDGLKETRLSEHHRGETNTASCRHDLTHTTMNGIGMKDNIHKVETAPAHLFVTERTILGSPSKATDDGFFNLKEVVYSLCGVYEHIRTGSFGTKGPDLSSFRDIPTEVIRKLTTKGLGFGSGCYDTVINSLTEFTTKRVGFNEKTIVLVC